MTRRARKTIEVRLDARTRELLHQLTSETGYSVSAIVRRGIRLAAQEHGVEVTQEEA